MPIKIEPPVIQDFTLDKADKAGKVSGEPTRVRIRQAAQGERERRDAVYFDFKREYRDGEVTVTQRISYNDVARMEVMLTLADCNILDADDKPLFKFKNERVTSEFDFLRSWAQLTPEIADEIHEKVLEVNLLWSELGK